MDRFTTLQLFVRVEDGQPLDSARRGAGGARHRALLPSYAAAAAINSAAVRRVMADYLLPQQEISAVFPSPRLVPAKVSAFSSYLQKHFEGEWWHAPLVDAPLSAHALRISHGAFMAGIAGIATTDVPLNAHDK